MRFITIFCLALIVTIAGLTACNSSETLLSQSPSNAATPQQSATSPADSARRIKAAELHDLWEKNDVVIIDTRAESAYKDEHIKGSISMPAGTVLAHLEELPKNKMIVAYCT
ncbi:MAG TPA: rhodanese-like domain-containing protein [Pyrinomonadaceae bacterium]|jgi:3-mercaptopyruvate sulfurtransferase SseA|nr:rhodanese-like domain-containing protein [Pyrinomonadaceae bacterium]